MFNSGAQVWKRLPAVLCTALLTVGLGSMATVVGQTFLSSVVGLVTDASGALTPDAQVVLLENETGVRHVTTTNATGNYTFVEVPAGTYVVTVMKGGFKETLSTSILLAPQATARFDATLEVGNISEKVEVSGKALAINTENAQTGSVVTQAEIQDLPVNSRGSMSYRYLDSSNQDGGYLGGQRSSFGFYSIDGVSSMAPAWGAWSGPGMTMSLEAVQDIQQVTSTPSAEFGDVATISLNTRSGTNTFHGSGFWQTNNYALDAAGYFSHSKPTGPYRQYVGGTIGGPVYIPHLYNGKNRTFFFFDWEEFMQPGHYESQGSVPVSAFRNGDFSSLLADANGNTVIYDPTTGTPFTGNVIPANRISPVSQKLQQYFPSANFGTDLYSNYLQVFPNAHPHYYPTVRGDHNFRDGKDAISGRYTYRHQNEDGNYTGLPGFDKIQNRNTKNAYVSETHVFSPTVLNEFRVGYSQDFSNYHGTTKGADILSATGLQVPNASQVSSLYGFPQVNFDNYSGFFATDAGWDQHTWEFLDNVTLSRGKHTLKVGASIRRYGVNETVGDNSMAFGSVNFSTLATQDANGNGGYDYASFLLGIPNSSQTTGKAPTADVTYGTNAAYIQDDWKISPKLTLNLGLRWEHTSTPVDANNMRFTFDPATGNLVVPNQTVISTLVSPVFPKDIPIVTAAQAGFPDRSLVSSDQNFGPRAGFAYRLPNQLVIRGGFGLVYTPLLTYAMIDSFDGGPFQLQQTFHNRITNGVAALQFPNPFSLQGQGDFPGVSINALSKNIRTPYTEQWTVAVEKQLGTSTVVRGTYRGHHTLETIYYPDLNQPHVSADPNNEWNLIYPNFYNAYVGTNGGSEIGHQFVFELQKKYAKGLTYNLGYTHTKVVTDLRGSDIVGWPEYSWDVKRDSGNEGGLSRHRFVGTAIWELPFGTGKHFGSTLPGWLKQTLGNWETSYIVVLQSGQFLDPGCSGCLDTSNARVFGGRPNVIANPSISNPTAQMWFNPKVFTQPVNGTLGDASTGIIDGPGLFNVDFGLFKYFQIREHTRVKLQATATNAFNHPNLSNPNTNITSAMVGTITGLTGRGMNGSTNNMRSIMLGARFDF